MADEVAARTLELVEAIAETDEELLMRYLEGEEIATDELRAALRDGDDRRARSSRSSAAPR